MKKGILVFFILLSWFSLSLGCPSMPKTKEAFQKLFPGAPLQVLKVSPSPVKGLCEVIVSQGPRKMLTYIDESGRFLVTGRIIDLTARRDLTEEKIAELNRIKLSPDQLKSLRKYVAFSAGSGPEIFLVTDPDCPFCKRAEKILWPLIQKNRVKVNVIFFPLVKLHPKAKTKAVSMICEGRGFPALLTDYNGHSTCPEGQKKVEEGFQFLKSLGVRGTPTYIFPSGIVHSGVLTREQIFKMLKHGS